MSQIASFTYIKEADVPFLGFWSKPKRRLFRRPEDKFDELLQQHALRESVFAAADGVYVALVFAWLELTETKFRTEIEPVLETVRRQVTGSHWLIKFSTIQCTSRIREPLSENHWPSCLGLLNLDESDYSWHLFDAAKRFVVDRLAELKTGEALFISVG